MIKLEPFKGGVVEVARKLLRHDKYQHAFSQEHEQCSDQKPAKSKHYIVKKCVRSDFTTVMQTTYGEVLGAEHNYAVKITDLLTPGEIVLSTLWFLVYEDDSARSGLTFEEACLHAISCSDSVIVRHSEMAEGQYFYPLVDAKGPKQFCLQTPNGCGTTKSSILVTWGNREDWYTIEKEEYMRSLRKNTVRTGRSYY